MMLRRRISLSKEGLPFCNLSALHARYDFHDHCTRAGPEAGEAVQLLELCGGNLLPCGADDSQILP